MSGESVRGRFVCSDNVWIGVEDLGTGSFLYHLLLLLKHISFSYECIAPGLYMC